MKQQNEIVGHKTFADGEGFRHEPLTRSEANVLLAAVNKAKRERAKRMPDEKAAVVALFDAWLRLHELGWNDGIYCPKDGSHFQAITLGSTGIFDCVCEGEWPDCTWTIFDDRDAYPSSQAPALIKVKKRKPTRSKWTVGRDPSHRDYFMRRTGR